MNEEPKKQFIEEIIDKIFEMDRISFYLILIVILGFILRVISAINLAVGGDDAHFVTHAINFYSSGRLITYDQSAGLWFAFTSIIYEIFGITQLASRLAALIFGSFSIIVIYLLSREFFDEKVGLIAAFLLAIAPFHIKNTVAEMDVMTMFFVLIAMFLFVRALKADKLGYFIMSGIFLGLAVYTKVYPLLFIPSLLIFFVYWNKKENKIIFSKKNVKRIIIFLFTIFIFTIPALTHNYLLYKDKGFLDLQFSRTFGIGKDKSAQYYSWDHQFNAKNDWLGLIFGNPEHSASEKPSIISAFEFIMRGDPLAFFFGLAGLLFIFIYKKDKKDYFVFFLASIIFVLPFLASIMLLPKHYIFLELLLLPCAAFALNGFNDRVTRFMKRSSLKIIIIILFLFSLIYLGTTPQLSLGAHHFYGKGHIAQIMDLKKEIPDNALIVVDSRIYRGRINWPFQGKSYLEASDFVKLLQEKDKLPGKDIGLDIYFFECVKDDCGWGTVKDQPEFNQSMESIVSFFKNGGSLVKKISEPYEEKPYYPFFYGEREDIINVYKAKIPLKDSILLITKQPKNWFLYDIGYEPKEKQFDYYNTTGIDVLIDKTAHFVVFLSLIFAFLSPLYVIYPLFRK